MKKSEIREALLKHIEKFHLITIERKKVDDNPLYCMPLFIGEKLALLRNYHDFSFDGFLIARIKDFTKIRYNDVDRFYENIIRQEGLAGNKEIIPVKELNKWKDVFKELKKLNKYIRIEFENGDFINYRFGEIIDIKKNGITFHHFDGLGQWEKNIINIQFKDINLVAVDDSYTEIFSKYVMKK